MTVRLGVPILEPAGGVLEQARREGRDELLSKPCFGVSDDEVHARSRVAKD